MQPTGLMRWWSISWAAQATYIACAGLTFWAVLAGYSATSTMRVTTGTVAMMAAGVQVYSLSAGWIAEVRGNNSFSKRRLLHVLGVTALIGLAATLLLQFGADSRTRFVAKVSIRGLFVASVYLWIGIALLRRTSVIPLIRVWLGLGLIDRRCVAIAAPGRRMLSARMQVKLAKSTSCHCFVILPKEHDPNEVLPCWFRRA